MADVDAGVSTPGGAQGELDQALAYAVTGTEFQQQEQDEEQSSTSSVWLDHEEEGEEGEHDDHDYDHIPQPVVSVDSDDSSEIPPPPPLPPDGEEPLEEDEEEEDHDDCIADGIDDSEVPFDEDTQKETHEATREETHEETNKHESSNPVTGSVRVVVTTRPASASSPDAVKSTKQAPLESSTKVAERLTRAVVDTTPNRFSSPDLVPLATGYQVFRKQLRQLVQSVKHYQTAVDQMEKARTQVFQEYAALSHENPLFDHVGKLLDAESLQSIEQNGTVSLATTNDGLELQTKSPNLVANDMGARSLASLQQLATIHARLNSKDYRTHVIDYVVEWEDVVTTKLDKELKHVKKLQQTRLHYEKKVEGLRKKVNALESKSKDIPDSLVEKLARNEQKLKDAWKTHEQRASTLCILLEEVTERGWQDAYPLIKNAMKWEVNRLGRENITYGKLPATLDAMKASFRSYTL